MMTVIGLTPFWSSLADDFKRRRIYTHIDEAGMLWRFEGSRPVSLLADKVMDEMEREPERHDG